MSYLLAQTLISRADDPWANEFWGLDADQRFVVVLVAIGCATAVIITVTSFAMSTLQTIHRRKTEAQLKREMIDRGMPAEEIKQVIESAPPPEAGVDRWIASWGKAESGKAPLS